MQAKILDFALRNRVGLAASGLFIALVYVAFSLFFDRSILNPQNIGWISEGDLRQHYLGWLAFRQADSLGSPWGLSPLLAYPNGAPISSTDSNPLVSLILWPISGFLPETFQFIGPWYMLSLGLGLLFGTLIMRHAGFDKITAVLLGAVLAFQPILFWRYGHDTLTAQWLILAMFYVVMAVDRPGRAMAAHGLLLLLAITIHPYLFVMLNFIVGFDVLLRVIRNGGLHFGMVEKSALALIVIELVALYVGKKLGVFSLSTPGDNEVGVHSTDPLGFLNPFDASRILPQLSAGEGQYEGYAYLGLGGLVLLLVVVAVALRGAATNLPWMRLLPVMAAALTAYAFAALPIVTLFGTEIFRLELTEGGLVQTVYEKMRSSGRFVWITIYAGIMMALMALPRTFPTRVRALAVAVLALQAWDLGPLQARSKADTAYRELPESVLEEPEWQERIARADYIYMSRDLGLEFSLEAGAAAFPLNTPLTWFYTAQGLGLPEQLAAEEQLRLRILNGNHDETALYLLDADFELALIHRNGAGYVSTRNYGAFHSLDTAAYAPEPQFTPETHGLTEMLDACTDGCTALMVAHEKATRNLSMQVGSWLTQRGSRILEMQDGWGYALVLRDGQIVQEALTQGEDATLNEVINERAFSLLSSVSDPAGTPSSIAVDGVDFARGLKGLNLVMVYDDGQLVTARFDTDEASDSILPDGGESLLTASLETEEFNSDALPPEITIGDTLIAAVPGPYSGLAPAISLERLLTEEASLLDVLSRCRQGCSMAISVKDEASANLPFAVRRMAAQMGLTMAELTFRDGYAAIVQNGIVLVQGRSHNETVDVTERIDGERIRVVSAGFNAGSVSSIQFNGEELALGHRGLNIAVIFETGETISYHFDTHGAT